MTPEVEEFLDNLNVIKTKIPDEDTGELYIVSWRRDGEIIGCEFFTGPLKGHTSIYYEGRYYDDKEFFKALKMKAFW